MPPRRCRGRRPGSPRGRGKLVLVPVTEQPVAQVSDRCAPVARRGPVHQEMQRLEIPAQGDGRVVLGRPPVPGERHGRVRQMEGEGVRTLGAPGVEQQHAEPLRGDLGVRDAALQQCRLVRVLCAFLKTALDHESGFVQPSGASPHVVEHLLQLLGFGVEQFDLQGDELGDSRPEGIAQSCKDATRCLRDDGEPDHGTAAEPDEQSKKERRQGGRRGTDEQGEEVDLKADEAECRASFAEPPAVHGAEDERHEEEVAHDDLRGQQRAQCRGGQCHRQAQGEGDRLVAYERVLDREGRRHRRHGTGDHVRDIGAEQRQDHQGESDRSDGPQPGGEPQQPRVGRREPIPQHGPAPPPHCPHPALSSACRHDPRAVQHCTARNRRTNAGRHPIRSRVRPAAVPQLDAAGPREKAGRVPAVNPGTRGAWQS